MSSSADKALPGLSDDEATKLRASLAKCEAALGGFAAFLEGRMKDVNDDFRLGEARCLQMLKATEGLDITVERLRQVAEADMQRNLDALAAAAKKIDPKRPVMEVVAEAIQDKPPRDGVLALASEQSKRARHS